MEREFHSKLKNSISKYLKNKGFSIKKEARMKKLIIDVKARKSKTLLFECEIPSKYKEFLCYKNKTEKELLKLAFAPHVFVKKCVRKVSNVFGKADIIPILVVPNDYFPKYLKQKFSRIGIETWFVDLKTLKIEKLKPKKKFKKFQKEIKHKSIGDYLMSYLFSKYRTGGARERLDKIIERIKKDRKFFERLKKYFEDKDFKKLNKYIESFS